MSDMTNKAGPSLADAVQEVQGHFGSDAALQEALAQLSLNGFDRADFSLPQDRAGASTPNEGAANPTDDVDRTQLRTMGTGMAGYAGAALAAGATLATGGAAGLAAAAAVAVGAGSALTANAAGRAADTASSEERDSEARSGRLVLAVRAGTPAKVGVASDIMRAAGAADVTVVTREGGMLTAGVSAAGWTGG